MKKTIYAALNEDVHQGWMWLQHASLPLRAIVKVTAIDTGRSVHCECLQIDENFLKRYNQEPRIPIHSPSDALVVGEWYRAALGIVGTRSSAEISLRVCKTPLGQIVACIQHPQVVVRVAAWLGAIGLLLGLAGLGLGILSLLPSRT